MAEIKPTSHGNVARFEDSMTDPEKDALSKQGSTLADQSSSRYAASTTGLDHKHATWAAERKLLLKLDVLILPLCMLMYLSAFLDRGVIGNARLQGLEAQVLDNDDTKYSIALALFFVTYIIFNIPGTLLSKAIRPSLAIGIACLIWSIAASSQAATHNPASLYVCRMFVGIGEAGFGQAVPFYFTFWYKKNELAKRVGLYISCGALAGAFSGLISFGVQHIHSHIAQWRILFLIEGLPGILLAVLVMLFLPSRPDKSRYLTTEQQTLACTRLNADSLGNEGLGIDWRAVLHAFKDWKMYVASVMYSCMNLGLGSVGGFLPTIIKGLGFSNANAQLYTVPPYAATVAFMLIWTSISDRIQSRGPFVATVFGIGIVGWSMLLGIDATDGNMHARYFACFAVVAAGYTAIPLIISWQANCTAVESQRATNLGMLNTIGQCLSILAAFLFPTNESPQYVKGCWVNIAFQILGLILAMVLWVAYKRENKRRDAVEGPPPKGERLDVSQLYDLTPGFRYVP